jgi:hypothetical protein
MPFRKWLRDKSNSTRLNRKHPNLSAIINDNLEGGESNRLARLNNEQVGIKDISIVYYANDSPIKTVVNILKSISENDTKVRMNFLIIEISFIYFYRSSHRKKI